MEQRQLGASGLRVSSLGLGTMTFGGRDRFADVGTTDVEAARRQIDLCLDRGVTFFDTADVYSDGAVRGDPRRRRSRAGATGSLLATKARMPMGDGPNDAGLSRHHLIAACEASLRRLRHRPHRPLPGARVGRPRRRSRRRSSALDTLVQPGKVRYVGCSNFAGWQLMKALGVADRRGYQRFVSPADLLLAPGARRRVRARPAARRPGRRHPRLEPARRRPAVGQVPARPARARRARAQLTDWDEPPVRDEERALRHRRRARRDRRGPRRLGRRRSRSPGCSAGPGSPR